MTSTPTGYECLSREDAARVDETCDCFERAWKAARAEGVPPQIASYLDGVAEVGRVVLVRELIALDQDCRERYGLPIRPEDYEDLCPAAPATDTAAIRRGGKGRRGAAGGAPDLPGLEFLEVLGAGGMGVVWKARQAALGRDVAVKLLRDAHLANAEQRERFQQEARALARLRHPHLIQVHEFGDVPSAHGSTGQPYLVLEYVPGGSLADQLRGAPQPPAEAARLVEALARAIQHAHEQGIIHRDLKPANVLLATEATESTEGKGKDSLGSFAVFSVASVAKVFPKITDFGLARLDAGPHLTRTGDVLGTPSYMAPEQVAGKFAVMSAATDVYGLGAILYECLTGRPPFKAETALATLAQVQRDDPVPPRRLQPTVPRDLETICLKCLRKEPGRRYATAAALAEDLRCFLEGKPITARPVSVAGRLLLWARRQPVVAALATLLLVTSLGGFGGIVAAWFAAARARDDAVDAQTKEKEALDRQRVVNAYHEWLADNVQAARDLLRDVDRRDTWEWRYVNRLCQLGQVFDGEHAESATGVAYSRDGLFLASVGKDRVVLLRDLVQGTTRRLPLPEKQRVVSSNVEFSPDGRHLAVTATNGFVNVWDMCQEKPPESWRGHAAGHRGIATYSPDGRLLATACGLTVRVWDAERREQVPEFKVSRGINQISWSPDGRLLACASREDRVRIWEIATGRERVIPTQGWWAICAAFSPDGRWFAWAGVHGGVAVYETTTFQRVATLGDLNGFVQCLTFSPDGHWLAAASINGPAKVWDVGSSRTLMTLHGHSSGVWGLAFSPDGSRLATAGPDHHVHVWDITDEQEVATLRPLGPGRLNALAFSPNRRHLVTGQTDRLRLWDLETRTRTFVSTKQLNYLSAAFHPGGELFAGGSTDGVVRVLDTSAREVDQRQMKGFPAALLFTGEGRQLLVAGWENAVYRWEPGSPDGPTLVFGPLGRGSGLRPDQCVAGFSPDGRWLAYREADLPLDLWDLKTGTKRLTLADTPASVPALAFDAKGELLALGTGQGTFQVRDVRTGRLIAASQGHPTAIIGLAFTPDGTRLASTGEDGNVKIWDARSGMEVLSLREQATYDTAVAFSPDGELLVAGGWDGYPRVWSVADPAAEKAEVRLERHRLWHQRRAEQAVAGRHWFAARHHHGQLIDLEPGRWQHAAARGRANAELGRWDEARADFEAALVVPDCPLAVYFDRAGLYLRAGDLARYHTACREMLKVFETREDANTRNVLAWACVLAPTLPVAPDRPARLAEAALAKASPTQRRAILNTFGATLYRAGLLEEAIRQLDESVKLHVKQGYVEDWLFLAMAHHRLGRTEKAGDLLRHATDALRELATASSLSDGRELTWRLRVELELLLREAEAVLGEKMP